jgi:hypothetical protein
MGPVVTTLSDRCIELFSGVRVRGACSCSFKDHERRFAADAAAAEQLMVGRTLTVERVRQLNAKDYFYQMLKDNPEMLKIYPGIENELLEGAIDCQSMPFRISFTARRI